MELSNLPDNYPAILCASNLRLVILGFLVPLHDRPTMHSAKFFHRELEQAVFLPSAD